MFLERKGVNSVRQGLATSRQAVLIFLLMKIGEESIWQMDTIYQVCGPCRQAVRPLGKASRVVVSIYGGTKEGVICSGEHSRWESPAVGTIVWLRLGADREPPAFTKDRVAGREGDSGCKPFGPPRSRCGAVDGSPGTTMR